MAKALSYSQITEFTKCPYAWSLRYIQKKTELPSEILEEGKAIHEIIETISKKRISDWLSIEELIENAVPSEQVEEVEFMIQYWLKSKPTDESAVRHEYPLGVIIDGNQFKIAPVSCYPNGAMKPDNSNIRGKIDSIRIREKEAEIIDYKTGRAKTSMDQLKLYASMFFAFLREKGLHEDFKIKVTLHYLRLQCTDSEIIDYQQSLRIEKQYIRVIKKMNQSIETNKFETRPNPYCKWCGHLFSCPENKRIIDNLPKGSIQEIAEDYARETAIIKERNDRYRKIIKDYCTENGDIRISDGRVVGLRSNVSTKIHAKREVAKLLNSAKTQGVITQEWTDFFNPDMVKLKGKRLLKAVPEIESLFVQEPGYASLEIIDEKMEKGLLEKESEV